MNINCPIDSDDVFLIAFVSSLLGDNLSIGENGTMVWHHESCTADQAAFIFEPEKGDDFDQHVCINFNLPKTLYFALNGYALNRGLETIEIGSFKE